MTRPSEDDVQAVHDTVKAFVRTNFGFVGTLRLHRAALGWDLLRAPYNVAVAPVFLLAGLAGIFLRVAGFYRFGTWLNARRILLPTSVSRAVEMLIIVDLLENAPITARSRKLIGDYAGVRSAVAEITTSLFVLTAGMVLFGTATPGIASLAPQVSGYVAHSAAVADFPLGSRLGERWYDVFPVALPVWFVVTTFVMLAMAASIVTTFAGLIADPIQTHVGLHKRRLMRLLDRIAMAEGDVYRLEPEHILARLSDLTDAGVSLLRFFRS